MLSPIRSFRLRLRRSARGCRLYSATTSRTCSTVRYVTSGFCFRFVLSQVNTRSYSPPRSPAARTSVVLLIKDKRLGIPAAVIAFLVAFSRLYLYVHYPSDVIFSMFAGILLGLLGCAIVAIVYKFLPEKKGKYQRTN